MRHIDDLVFNYHERVVIIKLELAQKAGVLSQKDEEKITKLMQEVVGDIAELKNKRDFILIEGDRDEKNNVIHTLKQLKQLREMIKELSPSIISEVP